MAAAVTAVALAPGWDGLVAAWEWAWRWAWLPQDCRDWVAGLAAGDARLLTGGGGGARTHLKMVMANCSQWNLSFVGSRGSTLALSFSSCVMAAFIRSVIAWARF